MAPLFVSETEVIDSRSKLTGVLVSFVLVAELRKEADLLAPQLILKGDNGVITAPDFIQTSTLVPMPDSDGGIPLEFE